ncbi:MAG: glycoside hydrolase family 2 protein [Bacteroidetes bacterium]|nr:glycoside hydrolase family 2 protein [Bacteroidota bacterium]
MLSAKKSSRMYRYFSALLMSLAAGLTACSPDPIVSTISRQELTIGWEFRMESDSSWLPATVPGSVHTDLLSAGRIPDPFFGLNEKQLQWIGYRNWIYRTQFRITTEQIEADHLMLVFNGLDTHTDVLLNGDTVLTTDNMFRTWKVDLKPLVRVGENELQIRFRNVFDESYPKWKTAPFRLQAFPNNDQADTMVAVYNRKAQFHFGWDWGPRLVTSGIWRPVYIESWSGFRVENVYVTTPVVSGEEATIKTAVTIQTVKPETVTISVQVDGKELATREADLEPGSTILNLDGVLENPDLWWSNGLGKPSLTDHVVIVKTKTGVTDARKTRIGIRSLELVREPDSLGRSFFIRLNGRPVFMKGANYIPQDNFQSRVTRDRYESIVQDAVDANMNMLRVWGGGIYETDDFYQVCDEKGILVWQDMMFACGMYPADSTFLASVRQEVIDNVTRIRNHPSVALYCGNNECEISWKAWGWKEKYDAGTQAIYEADYARLFDQTIPQAIAEADPARAYTPSSPVAGFAGKGYETGDIHYWGVWHGKEPFSRYHQNVSRFVSEYGFQSYPEMAAIEAFTKPEDRHLHSEVMLSHQRCMADERRDREYGNRLIQTYMEQEYKTPADFESYVYVAQVQQAEGVRQAIYAHRGNQPFCMGTLYWQINDCWPVASWSSVDYYRNWKVLHYTARELYRENCLIPLRQDSLFILKGVTDRMEPIQGNLEIDLVSFDGVREQVIRVPVTLKANQSTELLRMSVKELLRSADPMSVVADIRLKSSAGDLSSHLFFTETKNMKLPDPVIQALLNNEGNGQYSVVVSSPVLLRALLLQVPGKMIRFSDNGFDLLPGEKKTVLFTSDLSETDLRAQLQFRTLAQPEKPIRF